VLATNVSLPLSPENIFKKLKIKLKIKKNKYKDPVIYYLIYGFGKERTKKKERKKERKREHEEYKKLRERTNPTIVFRAAGAAGPPCSHHTFVFYLPSFNFITAKAGNSLVGSTNPFHFFFPSSFSFPS
jgi:hypothetical protein